MTLNSASRRDKIAHRLTTGQSVSSGGLAEEFSVTEDVIRRDLRTLAAAGLCRRVYGGALPLAQGIVPFADRRDADVVRKRALARAAMSLIDPGTLIFLDNGSTNVIVAEELPCDCELLVATSSVEIAATLLARGDVHVHMIGGQVDAVVGGSIDGIAIEAVSRLNIDTCFLGICTLSAEGGVSALDAADATFKRALLARSRRTLVLASNEKIRAQAPHRIVGLDSVDGVIVEHDAPVMAVDVLQSAGAKILRAAQGAVVAA
jgi:DeoR/GlpR family transcriptional regulator of sugar metabolism